MTPAELREIGEALYGADWKEKLAEMLPVTVRCINYWLSGEREIREVIARRIKSLVDESAE